VLKVWLNDKMVGLIKLDKTQRDIVLLYAVLKVMRQFVNTSSINKFVILCSPDLLCLLHYITLQLFQRSVVG